MSSGVKQLISSGMRYLFGFTEKSYRCIDIYKKKVVFYYSIISPGGWEIK
jgi:hypothetical protein